MIDLSKLKAGDKVKFRCGGEAVVETAHFSESHLPVTVKFFGEVDNYHSCHFYRLCGNKTGKNTLTDIVEIIPAPFYWKDIKPGMAFVTKSGTVKYYIGPNLTDDSCAVVSYGNPRSYQKFESWHHSLITRAPEYDIPESKDEMDT